MDNIADLISQRQRKKAPAYPWQELALRIIQELSIPGFKRSAVFKICKELSPVLVERAMNDTKELCQSGASWKYFFKIADQYLADKNNKKI
ncbi:MAG: hypothetical protein PHG95_04040 [Patescibacteria group bacterium]|nr:hypothetical protein [Patescibacteria group bacterium]